MLRDVFDVPFDAVAAVLGRSTAAAKMLASRARGRVRLCAPSAGDAATREVIDGVPGVLITVDGRPVTVIAFTVAGDAITAIRVLADPARLAKVVPSWVA